MPGNDALFDTCREAGTEEQRKQIDRAHEEGLFAPGGIGVLIIGGSVKHESEHRNEIRADALAALRAGLELRIAAGWTVHAIDADRPDQIIALQRSWVRSRLGDIQWSPDNTVLRTRNSLGGWTRYEALTLVPPEAGQKPVEAKDTAAADTRTDADTQPAGRSGAKAGRPPTESKAAIVAAFEERYPAGSKFRRGERTAVAKELIETHAGDRKPDVDTVLGWFRESRETKGDKL